MLRVHDVSVAFGSTQVLDRISFALDPGFTGLVGANGSGKSTLLAVLAGALPPARGIVRLDGVLAWCRQEAAFDPSIAAFAAGEPDGAWAVQGRLGLDPAEIDRFTTLSPGERRRWQIGAALARDPAVLLLDEPTDHLDADARAWLVDALRAYRGTALVASHDRALLDALCHTVLRLDHGAVTVTRGGATDALAAWDAERRDTVAALDRASARVRSAKGLLADARRDRDATEATGRTSARMKDRHDHDARGALAKGKAAMADAVRGRAVGVRRRELDRAELAHAALARPDDIGGDVMFRADPTARRRLVAWRGDLTAGDRVLARDVELVVEKGEHIWIAGPNGAGKSTLLGDVVPPLGDRALWLPQELSPDRVEADCALLRSLSGDARGRVLVAFACLGGRPERLLASARPSPGEARKLAIALGLGRGAWLLALDEPTNHLDLPAVRALERALAAYDGALLLVTHDPALAAATTSRRIALA
jgi:ATPase subunit of ABC transporter with duplicated ATPase domains